MTVKSVVYEKQTLRVKHARVYVTVVKLNDGSDVHTNTTHCSLRDSLVAETDVTEHVTNDGDCARQLIYNISDKWLRIHAENYLRSGPNGLAYICNISKRCGRDGRQDDTLWGITRAAVCTVQMFGTFVWAGQLSGKGSNLLLWGAGPRLL